MPLLRDEVERVRSELFAEVTFHAAYEPMRAVRTKRWKFIKRFGNRRRAVLPNTDDSPSKDVLLDLGWAERELPDEELYDLALDPDELDNLSGLSEHTPVLSDLRGRLDRWMQETNDPLLEDPFPVPEGLLLNDPDAISPSDPPERYTRTSFPR